MNLLNPAPPALPMLAALPALSVLLMLPVPHPAKARLDLAGGDDRHQ
jgi:hypothetical protein